LQSRQITGPSLVPTRTAELGLNFRNAFPRGYEGDPVRRAAIRAAFDGAGTCRGRIDFFEAWRRCDLPVEAIGEKLVVAGEHRRLLRFGDGGLAATEDEHRVYDQSLHPHPLG